MAESLRLRNEYMRNDLGGNIPARYGDNLVTSAAWRGGGGVTTGVSFAAAPAPAPASALAPAQSTVA